MGALTKKTTIAEVKHYDDAFSYPTTNRLYKYKDVKIHRILDLMDKNVRDKLEVSLEDTTSAGPGQYGITHKIGKLAEDAGFKGILAPSAGNLIVFGGF